MKSAVGFWIGDRDAYERFFGGDYTNYGMVQNPSELA